MKWICATLFWLVLNCGNCAWSKSHLVGDASELASALKDAGPGDEIVLADREWRDTKIKFTTSGTPGQPITLRANTPGKAVLTGASHVRLGGQHLVLQGVVFRNLAGAGDWLELRADSKRSASDCRVVECAFLEDAAFPTQREEVRWISLYGARNEFARCWVEGKKTRGATLVVWLGESDPGGHRIVGNYFGPRPNLGKNGGETLRIGDSQTSLREARVTVEENLFQRCDGEVECISNKSCGNVYRRNTFLETQGTLTLRHGHRCLVEGNVFIGNRRKQSGGIRVVGEDHRVIGNHLEGLEGDGARSAITLQNGVQDTPLNGYSQVRRALIASNTVVDCRHSLLIGLADEDKFRAALPPAECRFERNRISGRPGVPVVTLENAPLNSQWRENEFFGGSLGMPPVAGVAFVEQKLVRESSGLHRFENAPAPAVPLTRAQAGPAWSRSQTGNGTHP